MWHLTSLTNSQAVRRHVLAWILPNPVRYSLVCPFVNRVEAGIFVYKSCCSRDCFICSMPFQWTVLCRSKNWYKKKDTPWLCMCMDVRHVRTANWIISSRLEYTTLHRTILEPTHLFVSKVYHDQYRKEKAGATLIPVKQHHDSFSDNHNTTAHKSWIAHPIPSHPINQSINHDGYTQVSRWHAIIPSPPSQQEENTQIHGTYTSIRTTTTPHRSSSSWSRYCIHECHYR